MLLKIYPENPNPKDIRLVVDVLQKGGIIVYPTDTIYGLGCDIKNAKAVKVELKRIEDGNLVLDPAVKTEADSVLLAVKDATTKKDCVKPVVTPVVPGSVVAPVVPIVAPTVPVVPVEKTYLQKLNEKLDNALVKFTEKSTELTTLGTRLLALLNALTIIK